MKIKPLLFLSLNALLFSSCNSSTSVPSEPNEEEQETVIEEDNYKLESISLDKKELYVLVGKRDSGLIVNFFSNEELSDEEKEVTWTSLDESIATIDQYGRVSGVSLGSTYIICETKIAHRRARCLVNVVESMDSITRQYQRVEDINSLESGDVIVFADPQRGYTATNIETSRYLNLTQSTFSSDKSTITSLGENSAEFILGYEEEQNGFTLEDQNGKYLNALNLKKICFVSNKGNIYWNFDIDADDNSLAVYSTSSIPGWLMFNYRNNENKFTLYDSSEQIDMCSPTIYRLTIVK